MSVVIPDTTPTDLLSRFRGLVTSSRPAYPDVLHLDVQDAKGNVWWFGTSYATYAPSDPDVFLGKTVVDAELDATSSQVTIRFSDGSDLKVSPVPRRPGEPDEDLENWKLFTPEGLVLKYGPEDRWILKRSSDPI
jgi:hypothetical protein